MFFVYLQGLTFFITPSVQPPVCDLKKIIESAGGIIAKQRLAPRAILSLVDDQVMLRTFFSFIAVGIAPIHAFLEFF